LFPSDSAYAIFPRGGAGEPNCSPALDRIKTDISVTPFGLCNFARCHLLAFASIRVHSRLETQTPASHPVLTATAAESSFSAMSNSKTLFQKLIDREIPAKIVYEDDLVFAFEDIKPAAPTHVLIVPKKPIPRIADAQPEDHKVLGHLLIKAAEIAKKAGVGESGFRLVLNNGPNAGESVPHLHCHILGGRKLDWPPG
jgi:histidine triad (HIT) family protein